MPETEHSSEILSRLFALRDSGYRDFHSRLMPTVDPERIIGVRTPALRKLSREIYGSPEAEAFLQELPHYYYEENNLHGMLLEQRKDYTLCLEELNRFLPYVDNWATCDLISPKVFQKHLAELVNPVRDWLASEHTYTIRYGMEMLMRYYLEDGAFSPEYPAMVAAVHSEEYYVNMMIAWYFATALAKQYEAALPYLLENRLDLWTHNKTIQKAVESSRITAGQKAYLRSLRRKEKP